jgi:hypothetical protein
MAWPISYGSGYSNPYATPVARFKNARARGLYGIGMGTFPMRQGYPSPVPPELLPNGAPPPLPPPPAPSIISGIPDWLLLLGVAGGALWMWDRYGK